MLSLFGGQLFVDVGLRPPEPEFDDNITISLREHCPPEAKLLKADGVSFELTSAQARLLARSLLAAAEKNDQWLTG